MVNGMRARFNAAPTVLQRCANGASTPRQRRANAASNLLQRALKTR